MPRRWRWLVPLTALMACALPRAAPQAMPDPRIPPVEDRVESAVKATTARAIANRKQRNRARAAQANEADGVVETAAAQVGDGYATEDAYWGGHYVTARRVL